jgi:hypothetical protein
MIYGLGLRLAGLNNVLRALHPPGVQTTFFDCEKKALTRWYTVDSGLVPLHIGARFAFHFVRRR